MEIIIYIYIVFFTLFSALVVIGDVKDKTPSWEIIGDVMLLPLGLVGMLLFQFEITEATLVQLWKGVSILIALGQVGACLTSRHMTLKRADGAGGEIVSQGAVLGGDLITVVILAPMLTINFWYAFA